MSESHVPRTLGSSVGAHIRVDGRTYLNFGGSSYLGLSAHPRIVEAGVAALRECGAGTPLARDQRAVTSAHQAVEQEAAAFFDAPAAAFLASGYYVGLVSLAALREQFTVVFYDELAHYSLREGIAAAGLKSYSFRHRDAADLEIMLERNLVAGDRPLVATDGLYSTFGTIPPLSDLWRVTAPYGGRLIVDESHSFGVLGEHGRGAQELHGLPAEAALYGGSLGKAFGACGGVILGSPHEIASFRNTPAAMGAGCGMPAAAAMCAVSLRYVRDNPQLLRQLRENVAALKGQLRNLGIAVEDNLAPIAAFEVSSPETLRNSLFEEGIFVYHSTYVGAGARGVIRCAVFADHTPEQIDVLIQTLRRLI